MGPAKTICGSPGSGLSDAGGPVSNMIGRKCSGAPRGAPPAPGAPAGCGFGLALCYGFLNSESNCLRAASGADWLLRTRSIEVRGSK